MAINFSAREEPDVMVDINTTPLIDVMLVLLIMLIITIPMQTHAVKLNLPQANAAPSNIKPQVDEVDIDFDGTLLWNGTVLPTRQALEAQLTALAATPVQPELHIRPDKLANYKYVAEVLASAQRLGVQKIGIVGYEQFAQ
ncbi:MAG: ExbD/TolR family protein [Acidocella sp.]|uniref:ExbD/TolR family protein n=1 Tax=Acidocella sp. TaxID=50710 RepID=UPI003FC30218